MLWLILALVLVAYRDSLSFSLERASELDSHDVEQFFFVPNETAPFIVFLMAGWLLYRRADRLRALRFEAGPLWQSVPLLGLGTAIFAWATYTGAADLLAISLCLNGLGLASLLGGTAALRVVWLPCLFLLFALPLPEPLLSQALWTLQVTTAEYAGWILWLLGQTAFVAGDQILLPNQPFQVIETCSGMRSIETLSMLTILMIDLFRRRGLHALLLLGLAPGVAFALNGFRVVTLILNPHSQIASIHNLQGIAVLLGGLTLLYLIDGLLGRVLPQPPRALPSGPAGAPTRPALVAAAAFSAAVLLLSLVLPRYELPRTDGIPLTDHVTEQIGPWRSVGDLKLDVTFLERIGFQQKVHRRYVRENGVPVEVLVATAYRPNRFRSLFSPKNGLPGSGWAIESEEIVHLTPDDRAVEARVVRKGPERLLVFHWYEGTQGVWDEAVRTLLALDVSPYRRHEESVSIRISTAMRGAEDLDRLRAERRLQRFYHQLRTGMSSYYLARENRTHEGGDDAKRDGAAARKAGSVEEERSG